MLKQATSILALALTTPLFAQGLPAPVAQAEKKRVEAINKVKPSVVAVMARDHEGDACDLIDAPIGRIEAGPQRGGACLVVI